MASWTDKKPEFNPYIAQKPVDAMVKVGMQKQAQYEQGYERIQQSIDNVAGMEVVRPEDKAYLESKMQQLGSKLQIVAAGDFSRFQLTNAVAGMADRIVKDDKVLGAVSSTQKWKTGQAAKAAANKGGTGNVANDYDFDKQATEWFNGGEDAQFNGVYTPYVDYKANALKIIKELSPSSNITEDAFTEDANGNLVISDAILREEMKGISPQQIRMALDAGLTPSDKNQMHIDGRYQYADASSESLYEASIAGFKEQETKWKKQKKQFENQLTTTTSVPKQNEIKDNIKSIDHALEGLEKTYTGISESIEKDPEGAKGRLAQSKFMGNFSKAFSYTETEVSYKNNPYAERAHARDVKNMSWKMHTQKLRQEDNQHNDDLKYKYDQLKLSAYNAETARMNANKKSNPDGEEIPVGGIGGPNSKSQGAPAYNIATVRVEEESKVLEGKKLDFFKSRNMPYSTPKEREESEKWLVEQEVAWEKGSEDVSRVVNDYFTGIYDDTRINESQKSMLLEIEQEINQRNGDLYSKIPEEAVSVNLETPKGIQTISARDLVNYNQKINKYITAKPGHGTVAGTWGTGSNQGVVYDDVKAQQELSPKEYEMYKVVKRHGKGKELTESEVFLIEELDFIRETVNIPYRKEWDERTQLKNELLKERTSISQPRFFTIFTDKPGKRNMLNNIVTTIDKIAGPSGAIAGMDEEWDSEKARKIVTDPGVQASISVTDDTDFNDPEYTIEISSLKEGRYSFPITREQAQQAYGGKFDSSPQKKLVQKYTSQITRRKGLTTSTDSGETNINNSYLKARDFTQLGRVGVTGNIERSTNTGLMILKLNIYDPFKQEWSENIEFGDYFEDGQILNKLNSVTDENVVEKLYNLGRPPTSEEMKRFYKELENPK